MPNSKIESQNVLLQPNPLSGDETLQKALYRELTKFAALLAHYNIEVAIDSPAAVIAWNSRSSAEQAKIVENFSQYRRICTEMHLEGVSLRDNRALLTHSMKRAELVARDDFADVITDENMVEIYSLDSVQIYRSINFFDYCNYSLLDLLTREWFVLYERLTTVTDALFQQIQNTVAGGKVRAFEVPSHIMKERDSNPRGVFRIDHQYCWPLFNSEGKVSAFMASLNVAEIDLLEPEDERFSFLR